jgi:hypothetical protein
MDNLNPGSDEPVRFKAEKIIISGIRHEAILTSRRLILVYAGTGAIRESIPYADITTAVAGINTLREPLITLSTGAPDGSRRETVLIFIHQPAGMDIQERDRCIATLAEQNVPVQAISRHAALPALDRKSLMDAGTLGGDASPIRPAVPDWTIYGLPQQSRSTVPEEPPSQSPLVTIAAVILVIGVCIAALLFLFPGHQPGTSVSPANATNPAPAIVPVPTPAVTPEMATQDVILQPVDIPQNGIWVRVAYPGLATGALKAGGWSFDVNNSITDLYQLPVGNTMIEGLIGKMDGSARAMDVEVYNGGSLVSKTTTTKPYGVIDLHASVGSAVISKPLITPTPAAPAAAPTPDTSLVLHTIPANGVYVRVAYPGNFTGSIAANGFTREVNSSGDQIYQLSMSSGNIDGYLAKSEGSTANMVVQVYKDGALVAYDNTSTPLGVVDLHATL